MSIIDQIKYYFNQQLSRNKPHNFRDSVSPIFIIGSPRSGTSILALAIRSAMKIPFYDEGYIFKEKLDKNKINLSISPNKVVLTEINFEDMTDIEKSYVIECFYCLDRN